MSELAAFVVLGALFVVGNGAVAVWGSNANNSATELFIVQFAICFCVVARYGETGSPLTFGLYASGDA